MKRIIGFLLIVAGASLIKGLDWLPEVPIYVGLAIASTGILLAISKTSKNIGCSSEDSGDD